MKDLITTFLDGKTLTDFYSILSKNCLDYVVDGFTIVVGMTAICAIYQNQKFHQENINKQELAKFQEMFNFLFQQYQSISTLNEDTQKAFHQKIINVMRAGNNVNLLNIYDDDFKQHYYQIKNMLSFVDKAKCISDEQKQEMLNLFYTLIQNFVLWNMAILMLQPKEKDLKQLAEKYQLLNMIELPIHKNDEDILPTLDNERKSPIGLYVEYTELGKIFISEFSSNIFGDNYFCTRTKEIAGTSLFQNGKYQQALNTLKPIADNGSYFAQTIIGVMYANNNLDPNNEQAEHYLMLAAKQSYRIAQYNLAKFYQFNQDIENALYWYELSAKQNYIKSCEDISEIYFTENSTHYDLDKAKFWAYRSAGLRASSSSRMKKEIDHFLKYGERLPQNINSTGEPL